MKQKSLFALSSILLASCSFSGQTSSSMSLPSEESSSAPFSSVSSASESEREYSSDSESSIPSETSEEVTSSLPSSEEPSSAEEFSSESLSSEAETSESSIESISEIESESSEESASQSSLDSSSEQSSKPAEGPASPVGEDFLRFFSPECVSQVRIDFSDDALSFISDYQNSKSSRYADIYVPAKVSIDYGGTTYAYEEAGIRMKGNTSRASFFDGTRFTRPVHFKISLKATFDDPEYEDSLLQGFKHDWSEDASGRKNRKNRNFLGLEKFDLKYVPRNYEECIVREIYAYRCFQNAGLMAPYATLVETSLYGEHDHLDGTYEFVETIDKQFLKRRLSKTESAGDLYKCTYNGMGKADFTRNGAIDKSTFERIAYGKIGVEDTWNSYHPVYDLKTNEDNGENSDFSKMSGLIATLWESVYGSKDASRLENAVDVQEFLSFSAVSYLLGNFDDQRYDYNNFYLYFRPSDGKALFLPYDWDWCLGLDLGHHMEELAPLDDWTLDGGTPSNAYQAILYGDLLPYAKEDYLSYVEDYAPSVLDAQAFADLANAYGHNSEIPSVQAYMNAKRNRVG